MNENKFILDACCGGKYMWYNKNHPNTIYMDIREEEKGFIEREPNFCIKPDIIADFRSLPKEITKRKYKLITWDIPHFKMKKISGNMSKAFGRLEPETWKEDINKGFNQLWDILEDYGIILLKFSNYHIKFKEILEVIPEEPLFFNRTSSKGDTSTKWFCFMKIPKSVAGDKSK